MALRAMTVGDLRRALAGLPGSMPIVVRSTEDREDDEIETCCALVSAKSEDGCSGPTFLALTASNVDDDGEAIEFLREVGADAD